MLGTHGFSRSGPSGDRAVRGAFILWHTLCQRMAASTTDHGSDTDDVTPARPSGDPGNALGSTLPGATPEIRIWALEGGTAQIPLELQGWSVMSRRSSRPPALRCRLELRSDRPGLFERPELYLRAGQQDREAAMGEPPSAQVISTGTRLAADRPRSRQGQAAERYSAHPPPAPRVYGSSSESQ